MCDRVTGWLRSAFVAWLALCMVSACGSASAEDRPNVLLIMTDDQGWGDVGFHGNEIIRTPNLDRLAENGVRFDRFFVSPVCAPTRASLLTGRYDVRTGVSGVTGRREVMRASELTIAEVLRGAGYQTGCFGKWHNGEQYPNHPRGQGFEQFFGFCGGHWNTYFSTTLEHNGVVKDTRGYITDVITDAAIGFIRAVDERPFFCYVPYNAPHTPWQVPDKWFAKYADKGLSVETQSAYAMIENIDHNVGRLLQTLEDTRLSSQTVVLFLTDNGPNGDRYNGGMRGRKGSVHEGGMRVPLFVSWPGQLRPRSVSRIAAHIDLLPTIAELCDVAVPAERKLDGRSLVPLLRSADAEATWPDRKLFTYRRTGAGQVRGSVRSQQFRFVREKKDQLYDMQADPEQKTDVRSRHAKTFAELRSAFEAFADEIEPGIAEPEPIPVGHSSVSVVELPGVEAVLADSARYHNGQGWAHDWISGFDQAGDTATWTIDVQAAGTYTVLVEYACDKKSVGATMELTCAGRSETITIDSSFDSPITLRPERVAKRGERPMRTFWKLRTGNMRLPAGRHQLVLKHLSKTPQRVDIGGLQLKRLR